MSFFKKWLGNLTELKSHAEIAAMLHQAVQDAGMDCGVPELGATANDTYLPLASGGGSPRRATMWRTPASQ